MRIKVIIALLFLLIMGGYIFFIGLKEFKEQALVSADNVSSGFKGALTSLFNLQPDGAIAHFDMVKREIGLLQNQLPALARFLPLLKNLPPIFNNINELTDTASQLTNKLDYLQKEGAGLVLQEKGPVLIKTLEDILDNIEELELSISNLRQQAKKVDFDLGDEVILMSRKLQSSKIFLKSFISWLKEKQPHQLIIIFQNPSEMRPAGGFIGSFAQLTLHQASMINLVVNDIYDIDGQLKKKIIPPKALQSITPNWGARDANWFFDFPTSAKKVMELLEASRTYKEKGTRFDGVIAINVHVINDVLKIIGPIELKEQNMVLDHNNFLPEIQRHVETNKNKNILKTATPIIFEKLGALDNEKKVALVEAIGNRIKKKDIMIYLDDLMMENFLQNMGVGGEVTNLPKDFFGEYLAVVNANIAGGKSDAFINQKISLASKINAKGEIINNLTITRSHTGQNEKDLWYRKTNQNYIQILAPLGSKLLNISGDSKKKIKLRVNYRKGYKTDPDIAAIENGEQFGKQTFDAWFNVPAGKTRKLELQYKNPKKLHLKKQKISLYHFIFDKQSGVDGSLEFSIEAPPGFVWQESGGPYFIYINDAPSAKEIISLQLKKL